jgi:hypothetical protein
MVTYDLGAPLRPQFQKAKADVTDAALVWLKLHGAKPLRSGAAESECVAVNAALRDGVARAEIARRLWPRLDPITQRRRLSYRIKRLVERGLLEN